MTKELKCVYFDLGNVLVDVLPEKLEKEFIERFSARAKPGDVERYFETSPQMKDYTEGRTDSSRFFSLTKRRFKLKCGYNDFYQAWNSIFRVNQAACELVEELRAAHEGLLIGVLSNTNEAHYEYLKRQMPVLGKMDLEILSCRVFAQKPQRRIYSSAVKSAEADSKECFFTDDLEKNIKAARYCGMRAFQFKGVETLKEDLARCGLEI